MDEITYKFDADRFREIRSQMDLTLKELAERISKPKGKYEFSMLNKIENKKRQPSDPVHLAKEISRISGIPYTKFLIAIKGGAENG